MIERSYSITELTEMFDVTSRTLRYYEELGLLNPERRGTQRLYHDRDRVRLQLILRGRRLGFGLQEISDMLSLYDADPTEVTQLQAVLQRGDAKLREIEAQIRDLEAVRAELLEVRSRLEKTLAQKQRGERE
ncbi:MerR family transcriptional regulator [Sulfoacidibacillus thermotolerans]|uniref:MerR family transcriptional regulator n=1 Tax=Sulfoacidibacillus thermotolerans TaxID=1765684 RepID=A0A2U3DBQ4_SULT2|nr:MerR family DNA-binding transcriptional regulator [Sulfoacidibacillus thermotolerans]PWI58719.1 MerR family transcriptional regulator [Sulfoacidibacillus thermotolerans]